MQKLLNTICYYRCFSCQQKQSSPITGPFCEVCESLLPRLDEPSCSRCATPLITTKHMCGSCITSLPAFDRALIPFQYERPISTLIQQFKYHNRWRLALPFANYMHQQLSLQLEQLPDCIIPVPMHPKRLKERGYDQALLLAKHIHKQSKIPLLHSLCKKDLYTPAQSSLTAKKRQHQRLHFSVTEELSEHHSHVLLIDDVMTTGATANRLARVLKKNGAEIVSVSCLARTCQRASCAV